MNGLHFRLEAGPGPTLLLVHGFPFDGRMWEPQADSLRGRYQLLIPDLPGFGRSVPSESPPSIEDYALSLVALLDTVEIRRAVLCGFSMGGYVALAFAARFPERLAGLVLADTRAGADPEEVRAARTETALRVLREGPGFLADTMPEKLLSQTTLESGPGLVGRVRTLMRDQPRQGVAAALLAMRDRPDRTAELARIARPTLVLCGAEDGVTPPAEMRTMAEAIPGARYAQIPGAGHLSNLENPEAFNRLVAGFLDAALPGTA